MATHSSIPAWKIPWTEEPGGLHIVYGAAKNQIQLSACVHTHTISYSQDLWIIGNFGGAGVSGRGVCNY